MQEQKKTLRNNVEFDFSRLLHRLCEYAFLVFAAPFDVASLCAFARLICLGA
jgi:hypothetical protein